MKILGSAAGGGVPQWNCNYRYSQAARHGAAPIRARLQSSIAARAERDRGWVLFNASPDIRQQIAATPELQPAPDGPLRATPIAAVVLTNADVDHIAGLLSLRERQAFHLYATARILAVFDANPIFRVLDPAYVRRIPLRIGERQAIFGPQGDTGIRIELFPVPGKVALFLERGEAGLDFNADAEDTVGVEIRDGEGGPPLHYVPGCAGVTPDLLARLSGTGALLFDGTVFSDDEMARAGVGEKTGRRMGHLPVGGADGSLDALAAVEAGHKVFVHINNTNPILDETAPERRAVEAAGWRVGEDGMEIAL